MSQNRNKSVSELFKQTVEATMHKTRCLRGVSSDVYCVYPNIEVQTGLQADTEPELKI